jgi:hypothetical protein
VALHLILLAFIKDFGHEFQRPTEKIIQDVTGQFRNAEVPQNLLDWLPKIGLLQEPGRESRCPRYWTQKLRRTNRGGIHAVAKALRTKISKQ